MIPKKIHYCWFGKNKFSEETKCYIKSWEKYMPDYELILWNEDNCNININDYVREAYEMKKYAFVSDFFRLYILYTEGGIYLDTDVEVIENFDELIINKAFIGYQEPGILNTGTIGAEQNHPWIKTLLNYYKDRKFILEDGKLDNKANTDFITKLTDKMYGLKTDKDFFVNSKEIKIYPISYLCANSWISGKKIIDENTYSIHHFQASWVDNTNIRSKVKTNIRRFIIFFMGEKYFTLIKNRLIRIKN
ncbi:glycosyltransferase family 32 protein [Clostridium estertheticum]|uniref:glycosyltransferase family 32 protein n=1 Tax=Clostridium estertheticum TaxID=238834 RepID=UPI001C7D326F|nr:glycosyltransferase [Clostridium estertheticum]MBX4270558.1 glycosyl transferase [Clostridium estertheticum]WLC80084.1 glycosyl transferase [Clostridium estertheticum]